MTDRAELSEVCTYCIALLIAPNYAYRPTVQISWPPEHWTDEKARILREGPLWQRVTLMAQALALGWPVHINDMFVRTPITTWHGDPVCETHLAEKAYPHVLHRPGVQKGHGGGRHNRL